MVAETPTEPLPFGEALMQIIAGHNIIVRERDNAIHQASMGEAVIEAMKKRIDDLEYQVMDQTRRLKEFEEQVSNLKYDLGIEREFRDR